MLMYSKNIMKTVGIFMNKYRKFNLCFTGMCYKLKREVFFFKSCIKLLKCLNIIIFNTTIFLNL